MPYILNIDTSIDSASICVSKNGELLDFKINHQQKDQAGWLQTAIKTQLAEISVTIQELKAVAVSIGPGSYTGLRIGLSAAKGLCYALNIPLIAIGTLEMMGVAAEEKKPDLHCPMIDARRMEVFTAVYNQEMQAIVSPCAMVLDEQSFKDLLDREAMLFYGNGSAKLEKILQHPNATFESIETTAKQLVKISTKRLYDQEFNSVAYTEPMYIKQFYSPPK